MATLNISIPDNMREWINSQIENGKYSSASDYMRDLVRADQRIRYLDKVLLEGLNSGEPIVPTNEYWADKKQQLKSR